MALRHQKDNRHPSKKKVSEQRLKKCNQKKISQRKKTTQEYAKGIDKKKNLYTTSLAKNFIINILACNFF